MNLPNKLYHYSPWPMDFCHDGHDFHKRMRESEAINIKPFGLWVSVEDDPEDTNWASWCEDIEFRLEGLRYRYSVKLKPDANILCLSTSDEIIQFGHKYCLDSEFNTTIRMRFNDDSKSILYLDWQRLYKEYDGLIIAPYNWFCRLRLETTWYYGWDCSSGCIWNDNAVEYVLLDSIKEIDMEKVRQKDLEFQEVGKMLGLQPEVLGLLT